LSLIERRAEFFENLIVSRLREVVNANGQGCGIPVGQKIRFGFEDLPDQSTGIVGRARCSRSKETKLVSAR